MISAVILTKNEENNLRNCIKSLAFCDEILVVDDNSLDKTIAIANELKARVFIRDMALDFSAQSNFGMEKTKTKWVLFVDADERISPELSKEIMSAINSRSAVKGFFLRRIDFLWEKK